MPKPRLPADDTEAQTQLIQLLLKTTQHFFGSIEQLFAAVHDPRESSHVIYPLPVMAFAGVLMFICRLGARRQINHLLRGNARADEKFQQLFGVRACPHGDTLNACYKELTVAEVQDVISGTVETLVRKKVWAAYRLLGQYYVVTVDGTGMLMFKARHCPQCLTRTLHGQTLYYHDVLEAKLVSPCGLVCSVLTEFMENPEHNVSKQDCEVKAFERLCARLKTRFPRLAICLSLDGIFAGGPTFAICAKNNWKYMVVLTEKDLPSVNREFRALLPLLPENQLEVTLGARREVQQSFSWVNQIAYHDTQERTHTLSVLQCLETKPDPRTQQPVVTRFKWLTNFKVSVKRVQTLAAHGGRDRWKTENEGFNVEKNLGYASEHAYSMDWQAAQVFYLLLQLAHLLAQLMARGSLFRQAFPHGVGSEKNLAWRLLEAWRNARLNLQALRRLLSQRIQIRFDSS